MYKEILEHLLQGDASLLTLEVIQGINQIVVNLMYKEPLEPFEVEILRDILHISNIIYNNTDRSVLVLEDGIYDLLLQKYKKYDANWQVGAEPVHFEASGLGMYCDNETSNDLGSPFERVELDSSSMIFAQNLFTGGKMTNVVMPNGEQKVTKRLRDTAHNYPELVGTLDKAKFVLDAEAMEREVYNDSNIVIFERDFLQKHVREGIINPYDITLVLELKYDGVSVEADVSDHIISARTRGDTGMDKASDLTPILQGYPFPKATGYNIKPFGMKFEAIVNNYNLQRLRAMGKEYVSGRNAIIGLLGSGDARSFAEYITLVPLQTSLKGMNRHEEIEFMNAYYSTGELMRYAVVRGDYSNILYQVHEFVKEAQAVRELLPFMYDGIVVSYLDPGIRQRLGRKNSVNKYSIAIKFNTRKKLTRFLGYTYTVGKNGTITPMINYTPVEFFGAINSKSSGHSYARFKELGLRRGDIVEVEFVNDVMAYVTKPFNKENLYNPNPIIQFPTTCPECGGPINLSPTGKNALCNNPMCPGKQIARVTDMLKKLGFKGFSEESVKILQIRSLVDLLNMDEDRCMLLGEANGRKFIDALNRFRTTPIPDYVILGSIGFSNIAVTKWKNILNVITVKQLIEESDMYVMALLNHGKNGIGDKTAGIITRERHLFRDDLIAINLMPNVITSGKNASGGQTQMFTNAKVIRFTGFRNQDLMYQLSSFGHDCSEGSVTKKTDILLIPYAGFRSTKVDTAEKYNAAGAYIRIVPIDEFMNKLEFYLNN